MSCRKAFFHLYTKNAFQLYTQNTFSTVQNAFQLCIILFQLYTQNTFSPVHRMLFQLYTQIARFLSLLFKILCRPISCNLGVTWFPYWLLLVILWISPSQPAAPCWSRDFPAACYWLYFENLPANQLHSGGHVISPLLAIGYHLNAKWIPMIINHDRYLCKFPYIFLIFTPS